MTTLGRRIVVLLPLLLPAMALGHGGEDHGDKPAAAPTERPPSAGGVGDLFEVLVKSQYGEPGKPVELRVFIADAATNEPIAGAEIELTFNGGQELKVVPTATAAPGIYAASVTFPKNGELDTVASVSRGDDIDLVTLGALRVGPPPAPAAIVPHDHPSQLPRLALVAGGLAVLGAALLLINRRLRRRQHEVPNA